MMRRLASADNAFRTRPVATDSRNEQFRKKDSQTVQFTSARKRAADAHPESQLKFQPQPGRLLTRRPLQTDATLDHS
jgi:hypothetical protein